MNENSDQIVLYNPEQKMDFLNKFDEATRKTYQRVLTEAFEYEESLEKDICNFNIKELKSFLQSLNAKTVAAVKSNASVLSSYIEYCIENGYKNNEINQMKGNSQEFFQSIVKKDTKIYYTDKEFARIINRCVNPSDSACFMMAFEGVQGIGCAEIVNLKKTDFSERQNKLKLTDFDGSERYLIVSEECLDEIVKASKQQEYYLKNGEVEEGSHRSVASLNTNDYVIRNVETNLEKQNEAADKHTIYRRCKTIADVLGLEHFTVKGISRSGMLKMAKDFLKESGEITNENYEEIADRFNFGSIQNLKEIVNEDTVKELYGEEF